MYKVTGTNLFGQWLEEDRIISEFRQLEGNNKNDYNFDINQAKLCDINWSYNIFQYDSDFYVTGDWNGKENQIKKVDLPEECSTADAASNLAMSGNDYSRILVDRKCNTMWIMDVEKGNVKKVNLTVEAPLENSSKRARRESQILKVVTTNNNTCLTLTTDGRVYSGILPSFLDTTHCLGKVIDVRCGFEHYMLLTDEGRVYTWGNGRRLQLGHGGVDNMESPTEVEALAGINITKIRAGGWHCFALSQSGDLYTWGWNDTGQLGIWDPDAKGFVNHEGLKSYPLPILVDILDENEEEVNMDIKDVSCGSRHSAIILEDNSVWTTGYNQYGQLGFSPDDQRRIDYFTKAYQCENGTELESGVWATVLVNRNKCAIK